MYAIKSSKSAFMACVTLLEGEVKLVVTVTGSGLVGLMSLLVPDFSTNLVSTSFSGDTSDKIRIVNGGGGAVFLAEAVGGSINGGTDIMRMLGGDVKLRALAATKVSLPVAGIVGVPYLDVILDAIIVLFV